MLLGNGRVGSRRGNVEWFQCKLDMNMFLQIQFQSGVKRNAVWNDLRGSEQVDAISLQMRAKERTFTHIGTCGEEKNKTKGMATSFPLCFTATPSIAVSDDRHVWNWSTPTAFCFLRHFRCSA